MITATVAICTRNRAELLRRCLTSLASQIAEPGQVEVLVVDNGSTDGTGGVLQAWQRDGEGRRVVEEPRVGLSHARNAALEASDREVVVFADDDTLTPTGWARAHLSAYQDPGVGAAGGPVGLLWPGARPSWISDGLAQWYGSLEHGDEPCPFPNPHGPYGVNMSVRRAAARAVGGFDPQLGRSGSRLLSGEEPDLTRRLVAAGWAIRYVPAAGLVHAVTPERIDRRWVFRRGWAQGVTNARLEVLAENPTRAGRVRAALKEASDAHRYWRDRRADGADGANGDELLAQARATAHAAAGLELLRLAVRDVRHDRP